MTMIQLTIVDPAKDKQVDLEVEEGTSLSAAALEAGLFKEQHLTAAYNGKELDLSTPATVTGEVVLHTVRDAEGLEVMRHSTAHLMAQAIKRLYPDCQITIGPVIEDGFYYDIAREKPFSPEELGAIEIGRAHV